MALTNTGAGITRQRSHVQKGSLMPTQSRLGLLLLMAAAANGCRFVSTPLVAAHTAPAMSDDSTPAAPSSDAALESAGNGASSALVPASAGHSATIDAGVPPADPAGSGAGAGGIAADAGTGGAGGALGSAAGSDAGGNVVAPPSRSPLTGIMVPTTRDKVTEQPVFDVTHPTDLTQLPGSLPVLVWANGACLRSDVTWRPLFDRWASAGFVVLSLASSGSDDDVGSMLGTTTKTEHAALIDWVVKANANGTYAGKLDLDRIVIAGNSCGAVTALQVAAEDARVAAVFVLSGASGDVGQSIMQAITIPVGYVIGCPNEDIAATSANSDYDALKAGVPAMIVNRTSGDHVTVSSDMQVLPEDAEIALNWLDLALYGTKAAYDTLLTPGVCEHCTPGAWLLKSKHLELLVK